MEYPKNRGPDAALWLAENGLPSVVPSIRASDWGLLNRCRFLYYLNRRLSLVPALRYSEALNRGSWFHARLEAISKSPLEVAEHMHAKMEARSSEICAYAQQFGMGPTALDKFLDYERTDMENAWAWFEAALEVRIPGSLLSDGILGFLSRFRILEHEYRYTFPSPGGGHPCTVQYDLLLWDDKNNKLWDLDLKSTGDSPIARAQTCPFEFQTEHYLMGLTFLSVDQAFRDKHSLPRETTGGGRLHLIIQKPTISLCGLDRDCTTTTRELTRGPRKGEIVTEKEYEGEPKRANYLERCKRWFLGTEEFADTASERANDPPVNLSITRSEIMDYDRHSEYLDKLEIITAYTQAEAFPENFPRSAEGMIDFGGKLSHYAPLYAAPIHEWPSLVARQQLTQKPRDTENTPNESGTLCSA